MNCSKSKEKCLRQRTCKNYWFYEDVSQMDTNFFFGYSVNSVNSVSSQFRCTKKIKLSVLQYLWTIHRSAASRYKFRWDRFHINLWYDGFEKKISNVRNPHLLGTGLGLGQPKQIFVFGSVWVWTEYSAGKPKRPSAGAVRSTNFAASAAKFFFRKCAYSREGYQGQK